MRQIVRFNGENYSNVLVLHIANAMKDTPANGVAQILRRSFQVNVSQVHRTVKLLSSEGEVINGRIIKANPIHVESRGRKWRERRETANCTERSKLRLLILLGFRDISTPVFPIVNTLASPSRFSGKSRDNL